MALSYDKRARMRLLAICRLLQREESQWYVRQWLRQPDRLDWYAIDMLAQNILQYVVCTRHPRHRREYLHDAELVEAIAAEIFPPKSAYQHTKAIKAKRRMHKNATSSISPIASLALDKEA